MTKNAKLFFYKLTKNFFFLFIRLLEIMWYQNEEMNSIFYWHCGILNEIEKMFASYITGVE